MATNTDHVWDAAAIRRAIRLLGSHSPRIDDPQSTARALRLVWDIVQRRGAETEIFQLPGTMPLVVVGHGPILLVTHLDDPHPFAQVAEVGPPSMTDDAVAAPGITRKAGVLAALGAILDDESFAERITLVIEADRHNGSQALAYWLDGTERTFDAAICEVADLPVPAPAIFLTTTGVVTVTITINASGGSIERVYGGVQPDVGHQLVAALASLKSADGEVLVPGFYDDVMTPDADGLAAIQGVASSVGAWVTRGVQPSDDRLSSSHLTLGAFLAPSIVVRELQLDGGGPYLASEALATIEAQIMPGQNASMIARAIADAVTSRIPDALTETLLLRPAAKAGTFDSSALAAIAPVIPVAPGNSPAGLLDAVGIPTLSFSTVWRDPAALEEQIYLSSIPENSRTIQALVNLVARSRDGAELGR